MISLLTGIVLVRVKSGFFFFFPAPQLSLVNVIHSETASGMALQRRVAVECDSIRVDDSFDTWN